MCPAFQKECALQEEKGALLSQTSENHNLIQATRGLLKGCDVALCAATMGGGGKRSGRAGAESVLCLSLTENVTKNALVLSLSSLIHQVSLS